MIYVDLGYYHRRDCRGGIGYFSSGKGEDAAGGALAGGCLAAGCLVRLAVAVLGILLVLWLFGVLFG